MVDISPMLQIAKLRFVFDTRHSHYISARFAFVCRDGCFPQMIRPILHMPITSGRRLNSVPKYLGTAACFGKILLDLVQERMQCHCTVDLVAFAWP